MRFASCRRLKARKALKISMKLRPPPPGIGGVFLGPIALAGDMGHGVNIFHPEVVEAMDEMIRRIKELGVPVGIVFRFRWSLSP